MSCSTPRSSGSGRRDVIDRASSRWLDETGDGVSAQFVDRDGAAVGQLAATLLIGADGIHSAVRAQLYPDEGPPLWTAACCGAASPRAEPFLDGAR